VPKYRYGELEDQDRVGIGSNSRHRGWIAETPWHTYDQCAFKAIGRRGERPDQHLSGAISHCLFPHNLALSLRRSSRCCFRFETRFAVGHAREAAQAIGPTRRRDGRHSRTRRCIKLPAKTEAGSRRIYNALFLTSSRREICVKDVCESSCIFDRIVLRVDYKVLYFTLVDTSFNPGSWPSGPELSVAAPTA
jgi:hypothetical protein